MPVAQEKMYCEKTDTKTREEFVAKCSIACKKAEKVIRQSSLIEKSNHDFIMITLRDSGINGIWFLKIDFGVEAMINIYIQSDSNKKPFTKSITSE